MDRPIVMLIEAVGIQSYIFGSNELAQHIGASELVRRATVDWVQGQLDAQFGPRAHNFTGFDDQHNPRLSDAGLGNGRRVEVIYAGGGNAMLLFADDDEARAFACALTEKVLRQAPGLRLVVQRERQPEGKPLAGFHQVLRGELARRKLGRDLPAPLLGLSVTADGVYTGSPATEVHPLSGQPISAEVAAKLAARDAGTARLCAQAKRVKDDGYDFIYDFDQFGTKGESTYLAIIHADGNRMGARIKGIGDQHRGDDRSYILALRAFSKSVQAAAARALKSTVDVLMDAPRPKIEGQERIQSQVPVPGGHLPFRPIVFGGDDVTFVCEGRLALSLATHYLDVYSGQTLSDGEKAHARAGVAVVKSHYPVSRAYDLAEALAASAKARIQEIDPERRVTALDWHFAAAGLVRPLGELRAREYTADEGSLLMRPVRLHADDRDWRTWQTFTRLVDAFRNPDGPWQGRRNKIKALREALRAGPDAVRHFLAVHRKPSRLPVIAVRGNMSEQGWQGGECGYFDVIEALDFFVPLQGEVRR